MKRAISAVALGLSASTLVAAEAPDRYDRAAHIPPEACRDDIAETLGAGALGEAIQLDILNSELADTSTNRDNNKKVEPHLLEDYVLLTDYTKTTPSTTEQYVLPDSGLEVNIIRYDNNYPFSPENLEYVMKGVYSTELEDDPLRSATYACYFKEIFENRILAGQEIDISLIGEGELCLGRKKVVPRDHTPNLCTAQGRHRPEGVYVLSTNATRASSSLVHEVLGHKAQGAMDAVPKDHKEYEYFAHGVEEVGENIMETTGRFIFTPPAGAED